VPISIAHSPPLRQLVLRLLKRLLLELRERTSLTFGHVHQGRFPNGLSLLRLVLELAHVPPRAVAPESGAATARLKGGNLGSQAAAVKQVPKLLLEPPANALLEESEQAPPKDRERTRLGLRRHRQNTRLVKSQVAKSGTCSSKSARVSSMDASSSASTYHCVVAQRSRGPGTTQEHLNSQSPNHRTVEHTLGVRTGSSACFLHPPCRVNHLWLAEVGLCVEVLLVLRHLRHGALQHGASEHEARLRIQNSVVRKLHDALQAQRPVRQDAITPARHEP